MPPLCSSCCRATTPTRSTSFHQLGATHFLVSPFTEPQLLHALQFALRHAERVGGGAAAGRRGDSEATAPRGAGSRARARVELSPALARKAGLGEEDGRRISLMELFRKLDAEGRRAARGAIGRVMATGEATAFAHADVEAGARIAHHVRVQPEGEIVGRAETIVPDERRRPASRDPLTGLADGRAARAWLDGPARPQAERAGA